MRLHLGPVVETGHGAGMGVSTMMISREQLAQVLPGADAERWHGPLTSAMVSADIASTPRIATFLAHIAVESAEMNLLCEHPSYPSERLMAIWPTRFPTPEIAEPYAHNARALANFIYANRLGNGNPDSNDGYRYRRRGLLRAIGRDRYAEASAAIGVDLVNRPDLLEDPEIACAEASWWWVKRGLNAIADNGDLELSTRIVNGGLSGFPDRVLYWSRAFDTLGHDVAASPRTLLIKDVQCALNRHGANPQLQVDGMWGPLTEATARRFRANARLSPNDGIDPPLIQALGLKDESALK
jgi:putative chitinase